VTHSTRLSRSTAGFCLKLRVYTPLASPLPTRFQAPPYPSPKSDYLTIPAQASFTIMTEYDYSPDAYERYLATQQRIARWTEETSRYRASNPFITSRTENSHSSFGSPSFSGSRPPSTDRSQTRRRSTSDSANKRPVPSRSCTAPTSVHGSSAEYSHSSSRSRSTHHHSSGSSASRRTSGSSRRRATASTLKTVIPNSDSPTYIKRSKSQSVLVPIDGGRYVIIPPKGTRLEVLVSTYLLLLSVLAWWVTSDVGTHVD
jgi:hypothetical protein